ncbi:hypothetical protein CR532_03455 [Candidatus Borreliella tachyglossi]|uniref:DZANK-type domain-containing protein n=1 Tax=Candidatus Borreliella tachyglossi TaxID=1964448 RepID=A0A2S1LXJ3_9SPIR|nr:hypothetical protein [Candidatus Borreliella tachyglossi]AWG43014.1 hypothetical protein CR532_03455 [Candidatus Borreliella tachyglossi]
MKKGSFEVFCEQCREKVGLNKSVCPNCKSRLGDIECPSCKYVGIVSEFGEGCPKCSYSPFEELKEAPFKRKQRVRRSWDDIVLFKPIFNFGININVMLYLFSSFLMVLLFMYILFY